jgi:hypothetical protein
MGCNFGIAPAAAIRPQVTHYQQSTGTSHNAAASSPSAEANANGLLFFGKPAV